MEENGSAIFPLPFHPCCIVQTPYEVCEAFPLKLYSRGLTSGAYNGYLKMSL